MPEVLTEKRNHVLYVTMNRPEVLNALNGELLDGLAEAWVELEKDDDAWVGVLTGAGRAFCAGADLTASFKRAQTGEPPRPRKYTLQQSAGIGVTYKPIIAAINGYAIAGGWLMAQSADIRLASETALMGIAEVKWNLRADFVVGLPRMIGIPHTMYLTLTANNVPAQRAYEMGFVEKVVPPDKLMEEATALAEHLCKMGQQSLRLHKRIILEAWNLEYKHAWNLAAGWMNSLTGSKDSLEGVRAFNERRQPKFEGR